MICVLFFFILWGCQSFWHDENQDGVIVSFEETSHFPALQPDLLKALSHEFGRFVFVKKKQKLRIHFSSLDQKVQPESNLSSHHLFKSAIHRPFQYVVSAKVRICQGDSDCFDENILVERRTWWHSFSRTRRFVARKMIEKVLFSLESQI